MSKRRRIQRCFPNFIPSDEIETDYNIPNISAELHACKHPLSSLLCEIWIRILCDHVSLEELTVIDTAFTNRSLRSYLMRIYSQMILNQHVILKSDAAIRWLNARGIRGRQFEVWHCISKAAVQSFFKFQSGMGTSHSLFVSLNLTGCSCVTDAILIKLAKGSPALAHLNLTYCSDITDVGLAVLAANCRGLETLALWGCYHLTNNSISTLATHCPRLTNLNTRCCRNISDEALVHLSRGYHTMHALNFTYCRNVTDLGVAALSQRFRMLRRVSFAYCLLLTKQAVRHLTTHCHVLEHLDLTSCGSSVDDASVMLIAHSPMRHTLRELFISACRRVTDEGIRSIGLHCLQLTSFHVSGCDFVTPEALQALPARCAVHNAA